MTTRPIPTWAKAYAAAGVADGIVQGTSTAEGVAFRGDSSITFNEAATVLNRLLDVEDVDLAAWYADRETVPSWAAQAVGNLEAVNVLAAGSFGSDSLDTTVTRCRCGTDALRRPDTAGAGGRRRLLWLALLKTGPCVNFTSPLKK